MATCKVVVYLMLVSNASYVLATCSAAQLCGACIQLNDVNNTVCHWCVTSELGFCTTYNSYDPLQCHAYILASEDCPIAPPNSFTLWVWVTVAGTVVVLMCICCIVYAFLSYCSRRSLCSCWTRDTPLYPSLNNDGNGVVIVEPPKVEGTNTDDEKTTFFVHNQENTAKVLTCPICWENDKNVSLNCGHTLCMDCATKLQNCPLCKVKLTQISRIYL